MNYAEKVESHLLALCVFVGFVNGRLEEDFRDQLVDPRSSGYAAFLSPLCVPRTFSPLPSTLDFMKRHKEMHNNPGKLNFFFFKAYCVLRMESHFVPDCHRSILLLAPQRQYQSMGNLRN